MSSSLDCLLLLSSLVLIRSQASQTNTSRAMERSARLARHACRSEQWVARFRVNASSHLKLELEHVHIRHTTLRASRQQNERSIKNLPLRAMRVRADPGSSALGRERASALPLEVGGVDQRAQQQQQQRHLVQQKVFGQSSEEPHSLPTKIDDLSRFSRTFRDSTSYQIKRISRTNQPAFIDLTEAAPERQRPIKTPDKLKYLNSHRSTSTTPSPTLALENLRPGLRGVFEVGDATSSSAHQADDLRECDSLTNTDIYPATPSQPPSGMSNTSPDATSPASPPRQHKPLVVGRTKPKSASISSMDSPAIDTTTSATAKADLNAEIEKNVSSNATSAAPAVADDPSTATAPAKKKEKAPKQPKPPKAAPPAAAAPPLSPALLDLRVGHILRAINHPNADSLYVSTIAMGDPAGTDHTQIDDSTGQVVRTVCSGLNGLVPLAEMQDRTVVVVANLKPVNMRSIKSAAMVLAASPPAAADADPHAPDRVVELVNPPAGSEAGEKVYFEGWPYGEGKGPEKQLNPKKKQWEAIQPGFFTDENLIVGFDAAKSEVEGTDKGLLVVEGRGTCTVKSLKGAVVR